jgi:hypothetical protein
VRGKERNERAKRGGKKQKGGVHPGMHGAHRGRDGLGWRCCRTDLRISPVARSFFSSIPFFCRDSFFCCITGLFFLHWNKGKRSGQEQNTGKCVGHKLGLPVDGAKRGEKRGVACVVGNHVRITVLFLLLFLFFSKSHTQE